LVSSKHEFPVYLWASTEEFTNQRRGETYLRQLLA
jgi:hypothetical protein